MREQYQRWEVCRFEFREREVGGQLFILWFSNGRILAAKLNSSKFHHEGPLVGALVPSSIG